MSHMRKIATRTMVIGSAAVLSLASAVSILPRAFADEPDEKISIDKDDLDISIVGGPFAYTGEQICPTDLLVTVWNGEINQDVILDKNVDYTFTCGENISVGEDSGAIHISNVPTSLYTFDDFDIHFSIWEHLQEISYVTTGMEVTYGDDNFTNELTETTVYGDINYTSSDENVAEVDGDGEVTITGAGETVITAVADPANGYGEGVASYTLKVNKREINITSATVENKEYDGTTEAEVSEFEIDDTDYDNWFEAVGTFADANVGTDKNVSVTLKLDNVDSDIKNFTFSTYDATATISPLEISEGDANLVLPEGSSYYTYSGGENKPGVVVATSSNGHDLSLTEGVDFTVTYPDNMVNAGDKTVHIDAIGNFVTENNEGFDLEYEVQPYSLTASNVTLEYSTVEYDGTAKTPAVTVKVGDQVISADDYTVFYTANTEIGTANVRVTAKADKNIDSYADKTFQITGKHLLNISGISDQTVTYTGNEVVLTGDLTVAPNAGNITAADLTTTWYDEEGVSEIDRPTDAGSYVVVYSFSNDEYEGSLSVNFTIAPAASKMPPEASMTNLRAEEGTDIDDVLEDYTEGFEWDRSLDTSIKLGRNTYHATYNEDRSSDNYTTLNLYIPIYGYKVVAVNAVVDTDGGDVEYPDEVIEGEAFDVRFLPEASYELKSVMLNGMEVTSSVKDNILRITAGTTDVDILASFRRVYNTIEGEGMNYVIGAGRLASFRFNVDHDLFVNGGKVYIDGQLIGEGYYTHTSGSTIITLSEELLNLFGNGDHTIAVVFGDGGIARASFSVAGATGESPIKTPNTGFFSGVIGGVRAVSVTALIFAGIASVVVYRKKFAGKRVDFNKK